MKENDMHFRHLKLFISGKEKSYTNNKKDMCRP